MTRFQQNFTETFSLQSQFDLIMISVSSQNELNSGWDKNTIYRFSQKRNKELDNFEISLSDDLQDLKIYAWKDLYIFLLKMYYIGGRLFITEIFSWS